MFDFGDIVSGVKNGSIFWTMRKREADMNVDCTEKWFEF